MISRTQAHNQRKVRRIIAEAVRQSRSPNQATRGTSGPNSSIVSPSLNFNTQADNDGNTKIPALFDVDNFDESYWQ